MTQHTNQLTVLPAVARMLGSMLVFTSLVLLTPLTCRCPAQKWIALHCPGYKALHWIQCTALHYTALDSMYCTALHSMHYLLPLQVAVVSLEVGLELWLALTVSPMAKLMRHSTTHTSALLQVSKEQHEAAASSTARQSLSG